MVSHCPLVLQEPCCSVPLEIDFCCGNSLWLGPSRCWVGLRGSSWVSRRWCISKTESSAQSKLFALKHDSRGPVPAVVEPCSRASGGFGCGQLGATRSQACWGSSAVGLPLLPGPFSSSGAARVSGSRGSAGTALTQAPWQGVEQEAVVPACRQVGAWCWRSASRDAAAGTQPAEVRNAVEFWRNFSICFEAGILVLLSSR